MTGAVVLLGPQRFEPQVAHVFADLGHDGDVALVTAGWGEREPEDGELRAAVGGEPVNLGLYARWRDVVERDADFGRADRDRRDRLEELQTLYLARLDHAIGAVRELWRHVGDEQLREEAVDDAIDSVRALDARHVERIAEIDDDFHGRWPPHERPVVAEHRDAIAGLVASTGALAISGGHVGLLARCLHLFNVGAAIGDRPVVAWSAGSMAVAERIVLFHDFVPHGPGHAEVHGHGLALVRDVVPLPHADRRLRLDDRDRMRLIARRFAPARLVPMDRTTRVECDDRQCGPSPRIADDGTVVVADASTPTSGAGT